MTFIGGLGLWCASGTGLIALKLTYFGFYLFSFLLGQWFSILTRYMPYYILTMLSSTWPFGQ